MAREAALLKALKILASVATCINNEQLKIMNVMRNCVPCLRPETHQSSARQHVTILPSVPISPN